MNEQQNGAPKEKQKERRILPQSDLDLQLMTIDGVWGKSDVHPEFLKKTQKGYKIVINGVEYDDYETLWNSLMSYYTRDIRLGNLSNAVWNDEVKELRHWLNLAGDCLSEGYIKGFLASMRRVATIVESSQSKGGWLRKQMNTFRQESSHQEMEPPKKSLFGFGKKKEGGM